MRRREFIALLGAAAGTWPLDARAQQKTVPVIGLLGAAVPDDAEVARNLTAFRKGLAETGYFEGQNVQIEYRWAEGHYERLPALAAELVARKVDVIVNEGGAPSLLAAKEATSIIPIVFHTGTDPVAGGLVASLARPGGNLTGVSVLMVELLPKLFQFVFELVPNARNVALLVNPGNVSVELALRQFQEVAKDDRIHLRVMTANTEAEIDAAFASLRQEPADALIVGSDTFFTTRRDQIIALAAHFQKGLFTGGFPTDRIRSQTLVSVTSRPPSTMHQRCVSASSVMGCPGAQGTDQNPSEGPSPAG